MTDGDCEYDCEYHWCTWGELVTLLNCTSASLAAVVHPKGFKKWWFDRETRNTTYVEWRPAPNDIMYSEQFRVRAGQLEALRALIALLEHPRED